MGSKTLERNVFVSNSEIKAEKQQPDHEVNIMINGNKVDLPSKHIDGKFCGDGRDKVEEEHPYQGEHQVCLPSNPEKTYNYMTTFLREHFVTTCLPTAQGQKHRRESQTSGLTWWPSMVLI